MDIYYVDCENVGLRHITQSFDKDFKVIYFTSTNLRVKDLHENEEELVCSLDRRKDALDYIIDTYLGYSLTLYDKCTRHHIVSNDTGFDNVIAFWTDKGYKIDRSCLHNYDSVQESSSEKELDFMVRRLTNRNKFKLYDTYKRWNNSESVPNPVVLSIKVKSLKLVADYTEEELDKLLNLLVNTDSGLVLNILGE